MHMRGKARTSKKRGAKLWWQTRTPRKVASPRQSTARQTQVQGQLGAEEGADRPVNEDIQSKAENTVRAKLKVR